MRSKHYEEFRKGVELAVDAMVPGYAAE